jgi:3-dehydroquinate synthase
MHRIQVSLQKSADESYDVVIERGILKRIATDLKASRFVHSAGSGPSVEKWIVITDTKVSRLYAKQLCDDLKRADIFCGKIAVTSGEQSKRLSVLEAVLVEMIEKGANRQTGIIALGGGVVGDLAGFVAASFMRGIPFVQVPTTLLAMVDSSVGGKVGVDLPSGKNLVGAFWQPKKVYIDPDVLRSLPMKEWKCGLGEAVKYGAIKDRKLWDVFEEHIDVFTKKPKDLLPGDLALVEQVIQRCVEIKAEVVSKDEKESGLRQILNFGHTFGHVVELMSGYRVLHGEAVAVGMRMAGLLANKKRWMSDLELQKLMGLLDTLGLGKTKVKGLIKDFVGHMKKDKKAKGDLRVVLVDRIGVVKQMMGNYGVQVEESEVKEMLQESGLIDDEEGESSVASRQSPDGSLGSSGSSGGSNVSGAGGFSGGSSFISSYGSGSASVSESAYSRYGEQGYRSGDVVSSSSSSVPSVMTPLSRETRHLPEDPSVPTEVGTSPLVRGESLLKGESFHNSSGPVMSGLGSETDLQRRLREMRERRKLNDRSGSGLGRGGFLPG